MKIDCRVLKSRSHIQILPEELALSPSVSLVFGLATNSCCFFELYKYAETIELSPHSDNTYFVVYQQFPPPKKRLILAEDRGSGFVWTLVH